MGNLTFSAVAVLTRYIRFLAFLPELSKYVTQRLSGKDNAYLANPIFCAPFAQTDLQNFSTNQEIKRDWCGEREGLVDELREVIALPGCRYHVFLCREGIWSLCGEDDGLLHGARHVGGEVVVG